MSGTHFGHFHPESRRAAGNGSLADAIYDLPAGAKLSGALLLILATTMLPRSKAAWLWAEAAFLFLYAAFSIASIWVLAKRLMLLAPFLVCVLLASVLRPASGPGWIAVSSKGLICMTTLMLLAATTPLGEILRFLRRLHTPAILLTTMALMNRYLFVLADETVRMRRARTSRTFVRSRRLTWEMLSTVAGRLFVRALERADRIYAAMCSRGWK